MANLNFQQPPRSIPSSASLSGRGGTAGGFGNSSLSGHVTPTSGMFPTAATGAGSFGASQPPHSQQQQLQAVVPAVAEVAWSAEVVRTLRPLVLVPTVPSSSPSSSPPRTRPHPVGRTRGATCSVDNEASRTEGQCRDLVERRCLTWSRSCSHEDMDLKAGIASIISIACSTTVRRRRELPRCSTCPSFHRSRTRGVARTINRYRSRTHCSLPGVNRMVW